jgi:hypothetical protein
MVILILPVPSGVQPGTFGSGCSAHLHCADNVRQMQTVPGQPERPYASVDVQERPLPSASGSQDYECDLHHILRQPQEALRRRYVGNLNCRASPHTMDPVPKRKRQLSHKARQARQDQRRQASAAEPPGLAGRVSRMSAEQVLERIGRVRVVQQEAEAELALLVDHAVGLSIGWPEIASRLGVNRQGARQHYQRRHRDDASPEVGPA